MERVDGRLTNTERLNRILREGLVSEDTGGLSMGNSNENLVSKELIAVKLPTSFPGSLILKPGALKWETLGTRLSNYHRKKMLKLSLISQSASSFWLPRFKLWQMKNLSFDYNWDSIYFVLFEIKIFPIKHELTLCLGKFCWGSINFMHVIWNWNIVMSLFLVSC